jgi:signal transduction histidine kinase
MQVIFEDVTAETRRHDLLEAYANQVVLGQEEERRHIAQELHDGPLQALIHLCRQIDALDARPDSDSAPSASLASMRATVEETVAELRSIARGLRPSILDDLGLVASLNQVVVEAIGRGGLAGEFQVSGTERRLPPDVELAVFRIAQEAVTNIERHASASHLTVTLEFDDRDLRLRVADDGVGFARHQVRDSIDGYSLGLPGMHERARLAGGRLVVRSTPGQGTTVEARVPGPGITPG